MMFSMITINEIPDADEDGSGGKKTLVVRFGRRTGVLLYGAGLAAAYLVILLAPLAGFSGFWIYLGLLTLPLSVRSFMIARASYESPAAMAPANLLTIRVHNLTGFLLIAAYVVRGALIGRPPAQMIVPLALVVVLYLPVAAKIFLTPRPKPA
jgi:1,4-dihydroxy-2-naphthoate octaprenyltransferase